MVRLKLPAQKEVERDAERLGTKMVRELTEIVQEAERRSDLEDDKAASWVYRMPFVGVRYYSYE
jgi:hypothetical protein